MEYDSYLVKNTNQTDFLKFFSFYWNFGTQLSFLLKFYTTYVLNGKIFLLIERRKINQPVAGYVSTLLAGVNHSRMRVYP